MKSNLSARRFGLIRHPIFALWKIVHHITAEAGARSLSHQALSRRRRQYERRADLHAASSYFCTPFMSLFSGKKTLFSSLSLPRTHTRRKILSRLSSCDYVAVLPLLLRMLFFSSSLFCKFVMTREWWTVIFEKKIGRIWFTLFPLPSDRGLFTRPTLAYFFCKVQPPVSFFLN